MVNFVCALTTQKDVINLGQTVRMVILYKIGFDIQQASTIGYGCENYLYNLSRVLSYVNRSESKGCPLQPPIHC